VAKQAKSKLDPETRKKANEVATRSGIPMALAYRVVRGEMTLNEALKRMLFEHKVAQLIEQHGLLRSAAVNVALGTLDLERAVLAEQLRMSPARQPYRSVLADLVRSGAEATFLAYGEAPILARVRRNERYDCLLGLADGSDRPLEKHSLLLVSPTASAADLGAYLERDEALASEKLGPSTSYKERFRSNKRVLFQHHRDEVLTRVVLRDGTLLTGRIGWFGIWEFELALVEPRTRSAGPMVVVFRHAMHDLGPAPERSAPVKGKAPAKGKAPVKGKAPAKAPRGGRKAGR
jgi:hypothetical protein